MLLESGVLLLFLHLFPVHCAISPLKGPRKVHAEHIYNGGDRTQFETTPWGRCVNGLKSADTRRPLYPRRTVSGSGNGGITSKNLRTNHGCTLKYSASKFEHLFATVEKYNQYYPINNRKRTWFLCQFCENMIFSAFWGKDPDLRDGSKLRLQSAHCFGIRGSVL